MLYRIFMPKRGISVTLHEDNLLWLQSRTLSSKGRSLSETLDAIVTAARTAKQAPQAAVRSVVGTVDIAAEDPGLERADSYLRAIIEASVSRPVVAREARAPYRAKGRRPRRG